MNRIKLNSIAIGILFCLMNSAFSAKAETGEKLLKGEFKWGTDPRAIVKYLYYLPVEYKADRKARWPLMLFLHGAGERSDDVEKVAVHGPLKLVRQGREFPFIIIAPLCGTNQHWDNAPLIALLDNATKKFRVDDERVYVTGLSMGGYGAWNLGLAYPERFAAIAPMCGGGQMIDPIVTRNDKPEAFLSLPVWAFHCHGDPTVPVDESTRMVDALKRLGCAEVKLTVYPRNEHDCWTEAYQDPDLYKWLLSHTRPHSQFIKK